jgi:choice-of-anchor C domain-containing protein
MGTIRTVVAGVVCVLALALPPWAFAWGDAPVLLNGSFETYTGPYDDISKLLTHNIPVGSTELTGWTVVNGSIGRQGNYPAAAGAAFLDLAGNPGVGGVQQTVTTVAGATYTIYFSLSGSFLYGGYGEPPQKTVRVQAAGASQDFVYDSALEGNSGTNLKWREESLVFTASGTATTISLVNCDARNAMTGPYVDNVRIVSTTGVDLVVSSLTHTPVSPTTADIITFTVIVQNAGTAAAGASTLRLQVGGESVPSTHSVPALAAGATYTVTRQETLDVAQNYQVTATADSTNAVTEANEANNERIDLFAVVMPDDRCHPADTNCDWRITINEVTAYGAAWKLGNGWPTDPNPIDINYVTRAGYLWKQGECYRHDGSAEPSCWVPTTCP